MVYALGIFVVGLGTLISVPVATNYVAESFNHHGTGSTLIMTFYRLSWGIAIPFFIDSWIADVKVGWVFGMAAFLTIAAWLLVIILIWKGPTLRRWSLMQNLASSEEGATVFEK
jgi:MFS family permease